MDTPTARLSELLRRLKAKPYAVDALLDVYGPNNIASVGLRNDLEDVLAEAAGLAEANRLLNFHREECARLNDEIARPNRRSPDLTDLKTEIRAVLKAAMGDHDMAAQCVMNLIGQTPGVASCPTPLLRVAREFAEATIGPNEDPLENLARFTEWAKEGLLVVVKPGPPELPRQALREFIEAQIPDDENRQMTAYAQIVTFIEQATAPLAVARVERPEVEAPDFSAFDDPKPVREMSEAERAAAVEDGQDLAAHARAEEGYAPLRRSDEAD